ncbi:hypothetical protein, partial [Vibrio cholerae]
LVLLLLLAAALWVWRTVATPQRSTAGAAVAAQSCCDVRFTVQGDATVPVRLSLITAPEGVQVNPDAVLGRAPGTVRLPKPGTYTLRV